MLGDTLHWWDPMRGVRIRKGSKTRWGRKFHQCIQVYVLISVLFSSSPRISLVWLPEETDGSAVWCCQSNDTTGLPCRQRCTIHEKARTFFQWGISSVMASSDDLANRAHAILKLFDPQLDDGVKDVSTHQLPLRPKTLQDLLTPLVVETIEKFVYCPQYVFGTSARQFNSEAYDRVLELITMPLCTGKHRETLKSTVIEIYKTLLETSVISSPLGKNGMPTIQAQDVIDAVTEISIARMYGIPLAIYQSLLRTMKDDFEANCSPHEDEEDGSDNESLCRKRWRRLASILLAHFEKMAWYVFRTVEASKSVKGLYLRSISRLSTGRRFETLKIDWIHWASQAQDALEINHLLYLIAQFQMCHEVVAKQEDAEDEVIRAQLEEEAKKRKSRFVNFPVYTGCPVPESSHENLRGMYIHILETHGTHHLQNTPESNEGLRSSLFRVIKPPEEIEEEDTNVDEKNDSAMLKFGKKRTMHTIESKIIIGFFSTIALIIGLLVGILGVYKFFHYWLKLSGNAYAFDLYADDPHTLVELTEQDEMDHEMSIIEDRTNSSKPVHIVRPPPAKENLIVSDHRTLETDSARKRLPSEASSLSNQESEIRSSKSVGNAAEEEVEATNQPLSSEQNEGTYMIIPDSVLSHQISLNE